MLFLQLFGIKPCPALATEEFADRFMTSIKDTYIKSLSLLVK